MPLLPIDLQTLFTQLSHVGKEQAVQKEALPHAQSLQAAQLVQRAEARDAAVNETRQQDEGPEQVRDRKRRERRSREKPHARAESPRPVEADVVSDPALGRHVDLTG